MIANRLRIEPGTRMDRAMISINGIDVRPWITSATMTIKPGEVPQVKIRFSPIAQIPDDLEIELFIERKVNGHK